MSEHQIEALLAEIPADERATFHAFYQERLYAAMQAASRRGGMEVDPDQIEEELVDTLIREAEGRDSPTGMGHGADDRGGIFVDSAGKRSTVSPTNKGWWSQR